MQYVTYSITSGFVVNYVTKEMCRLSFIEDNLQVSVITEFSVICVTKHFLVTSVLKHIVTLSTMTPSVIKQIHGNIVMKDFGEVSVITDTFVTNLVQ